MGLGSIPGVDLLTHKFSGLFSLNWFNFLASGCLAKHKLGAGGRGFIPLNGPFIIMLRGRPMHLFEYAERDETHLSIWSRGMTPVLSPGSPGFNPLKGPFVP